jgi:hypothetical protein
MLLVSGGGKAIVEASDTLGVSNMLASRRNNLLCVSYDYKHLSKLQRLDWKCPKVPVHLSLDTQRWSAFQVTLNQSDTLL